MQFSKCNPEITLIFDDLDFRPSREQFEFLQTKLREVDGVTSVEIHTDWLRRQQLTAVFRHDVAPEVMLRKMASALRGLTSGPATNGAASEEQAVTVTDADNVQSGAEPSVLCQSTSLKVHRGLKIEAIAAAPGLVDRLWHWFYGTLAIASLGMAWVGLLVPGIPTVPFVLLTAHFALKTSDGLRDRLLSTRTFGPMMRDWHDHRAIRRGVRTRAYILTMILTGVTLFLAPVSVVLYAITGTMFVIGMFLISRIPVIETPKSDQTTRKPPTQFPRIATGTG
ncbi:MAG: YbaN family protein [Planctomycetota bacterium]